MKQILEIINDKSPNAKVLFVSPPPIGEDLTTQRNKLVEHYCEKLKNFCLTEINEKKNNILYVPFFELLAGLLKSHYETRIPPAFPSSSWSFLFSSDISLVKNKLLGRNWNSISQSNGLFLTVDHLHLNETASTHLSKLIDSFLFPEISTTK